MKIFGQITAILPLSLIISLPNLLFAHVPITNISREFTEQLEREEDNFNLESDESDEDEGERSPKNLLPDLTDLFSIGQYVRAVVSAVHPPGTNDTSGIGRSRDAINKASKRIELSLAPDQVNSGLQKSALKQGFVSTATFHYTGLIYRPFLDFNCRNQK